MVDSEDVEVSTSEVKSADYPWVFYVDTRIRLEITTEMSYLRSMSLVVSAITCLDNPGWIT